MKLKRVFKGVFISFAVMALLLVATAGLGLYLLNHPEYGQRILREIVEAGNSEEMTITYERGRFQLFDRLELENVKLKMRSGDQQVDVATERIHLNYDLLSGFSGRLLIEKILIENVFIRGDVKGEVREEIKDETTAVVEKEQSEPLDLSFLDAIRYNPFIAGIEVQSVEVKNLNVDVDLVSTGVKQNFLVENFGLNSSLKSSWLKKWTVESDIQAQMQKMIFGERLLERPKIHFLVKKDESLTLELNSQGVIAGRELRLASGASSKDNLENTDIDLKLSLSGQPIFSTKGNIQSSPQLALEFIVESSVSEEFYSSLQLQEIRNQVGLLNLSGKLDLTSRRSAENIIFYAQEIWPFETKGQFRFKQNASQKSSILKAKNVDLGFNGKVEDLQKISLNLDLAAEELAYPPGVARKLNTKIDLAVNSSLVKIITDVSGEFKISEVFSRGAPLALKAEMRGEQNDRSLDLKLKLLSKETNQDILRIDASVLDKEKQFGFQLRELALTADKNLSFLSAYELIAPYVPLIASVEGNTQLTHEKVSIVEVEDPASLLGKLDFGFKVSPLKKKGLFALREKAGGRVQIDRSKGKVAANANFSIPSFEMNKKVFVENSQLQASWNSVWPLNRNHSIETQLIVKDIVLKKELFEELKKDSPVGGVDFSLKAQVSEDGPWTMSSLDLSVFNGVVIGTGQGRGNYLSENGTLSGEISLNSQRRQLSVPGLEARGAVEFPWSLALQGGKRLNFDGKLKFSDFSLTYDKIRIEGVSGPIRVVEKLQQLDDEWQLADILVRNPFEKVDFERFQPFIEEAEPFVMQKARFFDKQIGPLTGFVALNQNLMSAQNFFLSTPSGGAAGEFFVDFYPGQRSVGLLARFDDIRFNELLPSDLIGGRSASKDGISGRSGFVYSLSNATLEGRVDVSQLARSHMITVIDVLDPNLQNQKFNLARKGLSVGYPENLSVALDQGILNLELSLGGPIGAFSITNPIRVPSLPVSSVVSKMSHEMDIILKGQTQ